MIYEPINHRFVELNLVLFCAGPEAENEFKSEFLAYQEADNAFKVPFNHWNRLFID